MKKNQPDLKISELQTTSSEFLASFNKNMPSSFPLATMELLKKFKASHESLFKQGDLWSLDLHRKKLIDWLPRNLLDNNK